MHYCLDVVGINHDNKDGTSRSNFVRNKIGDDWCNKDITIELRREKGNRSDKNAIALYVNVKSFLGINTLKIGYVSRHDAKDIAPQIDRGGIIFNLSIADVWVPDLSHVTPRMEISFDSSWEMVDVESYRKEKRSLDREKRQARKLAKEVVEDKARQEQEKRQVEAERVKTLEDIYGVMPYVWLVVIIIFVLFCCVT